MQITAKNYKKLLQNIQQTIAKTKEEIVKTVDRQKVEMGWKIGREIEVHYKMTNFKVQNRDLVDGRLPLIPEGVTELECL